MRTDFNKWPTDALRFLLNSIGCELDEFEGLNNHHNRMKKPPGMHEQCRVAFMLQYLRRRYWSISNELEAREINEEIEK